MSGRRRIRLEVNGHPLEVDVAAHQSLTEVLRTEAGATDVKYGCGEGVCGTCCVLLNGEPVNSCLVFAVQADGASVATLNGLVDADGGLHPLQEAFLAHGAAQCGFCTAGMVLTARWLLERDGSLDREQLRAGLAGNLCRCTGYTKILDAVVDYARGSVPHGD
jgi:carbon-monoxide dehydrogenase small subunit